MIVVKKRSKGEGLSLLVLLTKWTVMSIFQVYLLDARGSLGGQGSLEDASMLF
jgi:hypothetical protein